MHLYCRQPHRLQRVQQGNAGVGIRGRIDNNAVKFPVSPLDSVYQRTLVVGLKNLAFNLQLSAEAPDVLLQGGVGLLPIDIRLTDAQHVQVGAVQKQQLHSVVNSFSI